MLLRVRVGGELAPARLTTASACAMTTGSRWPVAGFHCDSCSDCGARRTSVVTTWPCVRRCGARWVPRNPEAPAMTTRIQPANHAPTRTSARAGAPSRAASTLHGPSATTRPRRGRRPGRPGRGRPVLAVAPMTVAPPLAQGLPTARSRWRRRVRWRRRRRGAARRRPPALARGRAAGPVRRRGGRHGARRGRPCHRLRRCRAPTGRRRPGRRTSRPVAEADVVGEAAGQHPRHLGDVGDLRRPEERLRVGDLADRSTAARRSARSARRGPTSRLDLPEPTCPTSSTSSPAVDREVDVADADRAVVVDRGEAGAAPGAPAGRARTGSGPGRAALTRSTPGGRSIRSAPPANRLVSFCQARVPGASVTTDPGDPAEPVEAADRVGHEQGGREAPAAREVDRPGRHDAALHHDRRARRRGRPGPGAPSPPRRRGPQSTWRRWAWTSGTAAASLTVRAESSAETRARPNRARAADEAAADRPATGRPSVEASAEATITASSTAPATQVPASSAVTPAMIRPLTKSTQRSAYRA